MERMEHSFEKNGCPTLVLPLSRDTLTTLSATCDNPTTVPVPLQPDCTVYTVP